MASGSDMDPGPSESMAIAESGNVNVYAGPGDQHSVGEPSIASSSQSGQNIVKDIPCPICQGDLTVVVVDKKGPVVRLRTECTSCGHIFSETLSSCKLGVLAVSLPLPQQGGWWQIPWTVELGFPDSDGFVSGWIPPVSIRRPT